MRIYDITLPMHTSLACWPGDTPYAFRLDWKKGADSAINLGSVTMGVHVGTHADAPFHFDNNGATIADLSLEPYIGPARVIDVRGKAIIRREDIAPTDLSGVPRVLLKTNAWTDHTRFPDTIPVMATDVLAYLKEQGVVLVGLDVPSVDALDSKDLPNHHALQARGIRILESLLLADVPEGVYELVALPLKLVGADGAPMRAILREMT